MSCLTQAQSNLSPAGFYFKSGGNGQDQWYQVLALDNLSYAVTDIYGQGFNTTFEDGLAEIISATQINVAANNNESSFVLNRVVGTDDTFPLVADNLIAPNPLYADNWNISELLIDPVNGEVLQQFDGSFEFVDVFSLSVRGTGLRFNDSNNVYFQGAMTRPDQIVFRLLRNPYVERPTEGPYATIVGSANNFGRDNIGYGHFTDINHFEVLIGIQSFTPDTLDQFLLKISGTRVFPLPAGDVNGDRVVDTTDRELLMNAIGQNIEQDEDFNIANDLNNDGLIDRRDMALFDGTTTNSKAITSAMTALWYDPTHDGAGWDLQILNDSLAHLSWYTYDNEGQQMWLTGLGSINDNQISFPTMNRVSKGTSFGTPFNPAEIVLSHWGSVNMYFESCNDAGLTYSSVQGFGHGGLKPTRLTNHSGLNCIDDVVTTTEINPFTGIWFDPIHDGEGWIIQVSDDLTAFLTWYTYDENGKLMWMIGIGSITGNTLTIEELTVTHGTVFGPDFNPSEVQRIPWGSLTFSLSDCNQGVLSYVAKRPELGSGSLDPQRLASVADLACTEL